MPISEREVLAVWIQFPATGRLIFNTSVILSLSEDTLSCPACVHGNSCRTGQWQARRDLLKSAALGTPIWRQRDTRGKVEHNTSGDQSNSCPWCPSTTGGICCGSNCTVRIASSIQWRCWRLGRTLYSRISIVPLFSGGISYYHFYHGSF